LNTFLLKEKKLTMNFSIPPPSHPINSGNTMLRPARFQPMNQPPPMLIQPATFMLPEFQNFNQAFPGQSSISVPQFRPFTPHPIHRPPWRFTNENNQGGQCFMPSNGSPNITAFNLQHAENNYNNDFNNGHITGASRNFNNHSQVMPNGHNNMIWNDCNMNNNRAFEKKTFNQHKRGNRGNGKNSWNPMNGSRQMSWENGQQNQHNRPNIPIEIRHEINLKNQLKNQASVTNNPNDRRAAWAQQKKVSLLLRQSGITQPAKVKKEKELPFHCDSCDRAFKTQEKLDEHISQHKTCGLNGCKFTAHPKIVDKHIEMQHETGLAEVIMRLNTPEDIQKWREERKKNYPTEANIARRQQVRQQRYARGEVIQEKQFGMFQNRNNMRGRGQFNRRGGRGGFRGRRGFGPRYGLRDQCEELISNLELGQGGSNSNKPPGKEPDVSSDSDSSTDSDDDSPFEKKCKDLEDGEIEDEDESKSSKHTKRQKLPKTAAEQGTSKTVTMDESTSVQIGGALGALMAVYSTLSSDDDEGPLELPITAPKEIDPAPAVSVPQQVVAKSKGQSRKGKTNHHQRNNETSSTRDERCQPITRDEVCDWSASHQDQPIRRRFNNRRHTSLLEKLLSKEIRHERNVIMQCVRYVVRNKFFGIGEEKKVETKD